MDSAVEEDDRSLGAERSLFGEGDFDFALPGADDRVRAGLFRGRGRARFELAHLAGGQALGVDRMLLSKSMSTVLTAGGWLPSVGSDRRVDVARNRCLAVPRQPGRRDAAVVPEEEVPGPDHVRLGQSAGRDDQGECERDGGGANRCLLMRIARSSPARPGRASPMWGLLSRDSANREGPRPNQSSSSSAVSSSVAKSFRGRPKSSSMHGCDS